MLFDRGVEATVWQSFHSICKLNAPEAEFGLEVKPFKNKWLSFIGEEFSPAKSIGTVVVLEYNAVLALIGFCQLDFACIKS